ncbi:MAG: hypothetical protein WBG38_17970 [Nodosilinea sp.]
MTIRRPTGITILAVIQLIGGLLSLLFGISTVFLGGTLFAAGVVQESGTPAEAGYIIFGLGIAMLLAGIFGLIAAYGLFTLKGWGWTLAICYSLLNILQSVVSLFQGGSVPRSILGPVIAGLILYYLYQPSIKRAFSQV